MEPTSSIASTTPSTLLAVISQRLLRQICLGCAEPYKPTNEELEWVKHFMLSDDGLSKADFRHGKGCNRCNGVGFSGRVGVFEMLEMTAALPSLLVR